MWMWVWIKFIVNLKAHSDKQSGSIVLKLYPNVKIANGFVFGLGYTVLVA